MGAPEFDGCTGIQGQPAQRKYGKAEHEQDQTLQQCPDMRRGAGMAAQAQRVNGQRQFVDDEHIKGADDHKHSKPRLLTEHREPEAAVREGGVGIG